MTKKFRFMVRLLAVVLAVVMLSSAVYIAVEADHDCSCLLYTSGNLRLCRHTRTNGACY